MREGRGRQRGGREGERLEEVERGVKAGADPDRAPWLTGDVRGGIRD